MLPPASYECYCGGIHACKVFTKTMLHAVNVTWCCHGLQHAMWACMGAYWEGGGGQIGGEDKGDVLGGGLGCPLGCGSLGYLATKEPGFECLNEYLNVGF